MFVLFVWVLRQHGYKVVPCPRPGGPQGGPLHHNGTAVSRDAQGLTLAVKLDVGVSWAWQWLDGAPAEARTEAGQEVYELLQEMSEADAGTLARQLGKQRVTVRDTLVRLGAKGHVASTVQPATKEGDKKRMFHIP